jgi:hypothetical protein
MNEENQYGSIYESLVNRYEINRDNHIIKQNDNNTLIIPKSVEQVLKKIIKGLEEVNIHSYEKVKFYSPEDFSVNYKYSVNLELIFSWNVQEMRSREKLEEIVNTRFNSIYPSVDNLKFNVINVTIKNRDFDKEFFDLFTKG